MVLALLGRQKSADFNFEPEIIGRFSGTGPLNSYVTSTLKMIYLGTLIEPVWPYVFRAKPRKAVWSMEMM